jgi:hypothetical protein
VVSGQDIGNTRARDNGKMSEQFQHIKRKPRGKMGELAEWLWGQFVGEDSEIFEVNGAVLVKIFRLARTVVKPVVGEI